jgi:hypothetical protein
MLFLNAEFNEEFQLRVLYIYSLIAADDAAEDDFRSLQSGKYACHKLEVLCDVK